MILLRYLRLYLTAELHLASAHILSLHPQYTMGYTLAENEARLTSAEEALKSAKSRMDDLQKKIASATKVVSSSIGALPRRPRLSADKIKKIRGKTKRSTTSLSLRDEKNILRKSSDCARRAHPHQYEAADAKLQKRKGDKQSLYQLLDATRASLPQLRQQLAEIKMIVAIQKTKEISILDPASLVTTTLAVLPDKVGRLVGKGGAALRQFQEKYNVTVDIDRRDVATPWPKLQVCKKMLILQSWLSKISTPRLSRSTLLPGRKWIYSCATSRTCFSLYQGPSM